MAVEMAVRPERTGGMTQIETDAPTNQVSASALREQAEENLRRAVDYRAACAAQEAEAKDRIAFCQGELIKAQRMVERMSLERPAAEEGVREAFDFYRYVMERAN